MNNIALITRANFLLLTVTIVFAAISAAYYSHRTFNAFEAVLLLVGALLTDAAVNALNNYLTAARTLIREQLKRPSAVASTYL